MAPSADIVDRLAEHRTLNGVPRAQLEWLAGHGELLKLDVGSVVSSPDHRPTHLYILLSGAVTIYRNRGGARRKVMEWRAGDITGVLPYSRMGLAPGESVAEEPTETLAVHESAFPEMIRECPDVVAVLVHLMLDRARHFQSYDLSDEKLKSLGRLSARLAHELNNPASAAERSAAGLIAQLAELDAASRVLGATPLTPEQLASLEEVRSECQAVVRHQVRSTMEQADREDAMGDWLDAHGADPDTAHALAESNVSLDLLDRLAATIDKPALDAALRSIAAGCATRALAAEIESAAARIHDLVSAMKGFSYMDRAAGPAPFDLSKNLADTLTIHQWKARQKSIAVSISVAPGMPVVVGVGGELNQVWANLLDNALDAAPEGGHVSVRASCRGRNLLVSVEDDGPGVPASIRERIFEPLFTTKPVGAGTGQGLDIARKVVDSHGGDITVDSEPGRTVFTVTLPLAGKPQ
jgi:signal transduction histidine kinase